VGRFPGRQGRPISAAGSITCNLRLPRNKLSRTHIEDGALSIRVFGRNAWWRRFPRLAPGRNIGRGSTILAQNAPDGERHALTRAQAKSRSPVVKLPE